MLGFCLVICAILLAAGVPPAAAETPPPEPKTVAGVIADCGEPMRARLRPAFAKANIDYPPARQVWIALKAERLFYVFAPDRKGKMRRVLVYPIIGASGAAGPKLREGDKQVPEGFYEIDRFRPNVIAHLGLSVNYPSVEDVARARADRRKRENLGGDIMIHGSYFSTGCLAMGDEAIEELFVLAHDSGLKTISLIFAPCNLARRKPEIDYKKQPPWVAALHERIAGALATYSLD